MSTNDLDDFFADRPETYEIFRALERRISAIGPNNISVGSQISFDAGKRKFAWVWLYNVTRKNPNGILHLMLAIDERIDDPHIRAVNPIGKNRWNHQIVVRTLEDAESKWMSGLIERAYQYGSKP